MEDADNGGGSACTESGGVWSIAIPSSQFRCEPKTKTCMQMLTEPFMYNCKATKISSVGESVNKLWYIQTMEYYPVL